MISLPGGVFKPYAGVSTAILVFTKTNSGGTDYVWFYDVDANGWTRTSEWMRSPDQEVSSSIARSELIRQQRK